MKVFMTGGTGFVGAYLSRELAQAGHTITILSRRPQSPAPPQAGISFFTGDPNQEGPWMALVPEHDWIINLAGASIFSRWTEARKKEILESQGAHHPQSGGRPDQRGPAAAFLQHLGGGLLRAPGGGGSHGRLPAGRQFPGGVGPELGSGSPEGSGPGNPGGGHPFRRRPGPKRRGPVSDDAPVQEVFRRAHRLRGPVVLLDPPGRPSPGPSGSSRKIRRFPAR